ncbi:cytochrome c-type biogenesis protein CcmE [Pseudochelatococcus lubricantis]|uniref:Cytochrome c-type biogenesis protein CcmE n=1 Tax=Pseudochelatococcus lubricantis TaxID=1538102 RepID=A0ABX0V200_9HYPH|nr:cytochrome c maturation protein CcmE [Pseudochelatococcus lubricantis]NIJ58589.1 cytochrome c-type biogenesis protein CcmE [Pseudochelatococcus lubricantis]
MTRKQRRLTLIAGGLAVLGTALGLVLFAMRDTIVFFRSPADITAMNIAPGTRMRLGGLVKEGSIARPGGQTIHFVVTDGAGDIAVRYTGLLPDLFREGQGVVTEGVLAPDGSFAADSVLAKHDENYMPREVADALKEKGLWQHAESGGDAATVTQ